MKSFLEIFFCILVLNFQQGNIIELSNTLRSSFLSSIILAFQLSSVQLKLFFIFCMYMHIYPPAKCKYWKVIYRILLNGYSWLLQDFGNEHSIYLRFCRSFKTGFLQVKKSTSFQEVEGFCLKEGFCFKYHWCSQAGCGTQSSYKIPWDHQIKVEKGNN